ncbi:TetR/AcrR family transcriptional regulator [Nocardia goodfellowii]|uniref:AcrR family transcriptional regulator n=1 Tax=Nocardia goodfellowii TaxID=882446 RepID=A0ABS4Q6G3_9NOCA|nr:TetR/AcrR family transcriptional regulator [Nocardia goodfellowii]MBP2187277.1 AcrR family transcriptional regulator [Nocardia goodfellowii]
MLEDSSTGPTADPEPVPGGKPATGLRERKKQQTRSRIIEIALDLCDEQGFEATTVEQIAHAADVSPRTVNRYFEIKEDIVLGPVEDFGQAIAGLLRARPSIDNPLQAMCDAYLHMVDLAAGNAADELISFRRFQKMQRIVRSSPAVNARAMEYGDRKAEAVTAALADRLGMEPDALKVRLAVATWQMMCHIAFDADPDLVLTGEPRVAARATRAIVLRAFDELRDLCGAPLST